LSERIIYYVRVFILIFMERIKMKNNSDHEFFMRQHTSVGSKRLTIPLEEKEHITNTIEVLEYCLGQLKQISKQRVPLYLRLLHARMVIADCSYSLKSKANRDTKEGNHYKGAV